MTNLHDTHPTRLRRGTASTILLRMVHRRIGSALVSLIALSSATGCGGAWYESWGIQSEAELSQPASIPKLIQALDDPMFACSAAGHLGGFGADAKDAVPKLKAMLGRCYWHGARNSASAAAATALVKIAGPEALPALVEGLASPSFSHRAECTIGLLQLGPAAASAVPQLLVALGDPEWAGRWLAAKALGAIGPGAGAATSALALALKDQGDWYIRAEAADALGAIGVASPEVVAALEGD